MKMIGLFSVLVTLGACAAPEVTYAPTPSSIHSIYWSDGDSGRLDGTDFRIANIDAPETGGVGAAVGGANCEAGRVLGFEAKAFMVDLTKDVELVVTSVYGEDRHGRLIVDLSANGLDVGQAGLQAGVLRSWRHDTPNNPTKGLEPKPDWCG